MDPKQLLRLEGIAVFLAATTAFAWLDGPLAVYLLLALAPDISMLGYLRGPRVGSITYNAAHTYLAPLALLVVGLWLSATPVAWVALVWTAHVGADRALGYGLKYSTGFRDTHLSNGYNREEQPRSEEVFVQGSRGPLGKMYEAIRKRVSDSDSPE